jgi:hypothetical protein
MINQFAKLSLAATSIAPIFLTLWFVDFSRNWDWHDGAVYLAAAGFLTGLCALLLHLAHIQLEALPVDIESVRTADNEMIGFILAYLLPLIDKTSLNIDISVLLFVMFLLFIVVITSNSYHFNPLIGFLGYHFYEVTLSGGVSYVLISRKHIRDCKGIKSVGHVSEYMIMEA